MVTGKPGIRGRGHQKYGRPLRGIGSLRAIRLAASGQVFGPALAAFWYLGEFGEGEEWQVLLKTEAARYPELKAHLIEKHLWQNPEVTAFKIEDGATPYLEWISRATSPE